LFLKAQKWLNAAVFQKANNKFVEKFKEAGSLNSGVHAKTCFLKQKIIKYGGRKTTSCRGLIFLLRPHNNLQ
jgi:hypothetical protein